MNKHGNKPLVRKDAIVLASIWAIMIATTSCSDNESDCHHPMVPDIDTEIEPLVTIDGGVFGQIVFYDDTGCSPTQEISEYEVTFYNRTGDADEDMSKPPTAKAVSNEKGFYEIQLPSGSYWACAEYCIDFDLPAEGTIRLDFWAGSGWKLERKSIQP